MVKKPASVRCPFCDYLSGRRSYSFVWREENVAVAVTREQRGVSHLIIFPTRHVSTLLELDDDIAGDLMLALRDAAVVIDRADSRPGISVWQNNGVAAAQTVGHLHFHVAGTLPEGGTDFGDVEEISLSEARAIAARLAPYVPDRVGAGRLLL
jgi:histidine triad (HIT) family protein